MSELDVRLARVETGDGAHVDLAVHPPEVRPDTSVAVVHVHGKGGNFYGLPFRPLAPRMERLGAVHVSVNMRSHDLGYTRTDVPSADSVVTRDVAVGGGWWEDLDVGHHDVAAAVDHLRDLGAKDVFVVGHSAGGFYAADYAARNPGAVRGIVMLSPLTSNKTNLKMWFPEPGQQERTLELARRMVEAGHGHRIIPLDAWYYGVSARTLLQRAAEPDGVWVRNLDAAGCPVLVMWGSMESRGPLFRDLVAELGTADKAVVEIPGCEHNYIGFEDDAAVHTMEFIERLIGRAGS